MLGQIKKKKQEKKRNDTGPISSMFTISDQLQSTTIRLIS